MTYEIIGVIASLVGLITPESKSFATSITQSAQSKNIQNINLPRRNLQVNIGNSANDTEVTAIQKGMQYKEARQLLIQQGWKPNLPVSTSKLPNLNNLAVKEVLDLGYEEVKDCSGTGLGLCRFEFTNQKGEMLVVSATKAESESGEPLVERWFIEKNTDTAQQSSFPRDDNRFIQQDFSQKLFEQVHQINRACGFYDVTSPCSSRKYTFRDIVLITERNGTESVTNTLIPNQPISRVKALSYSRIINGREEVNFDSPELQPGKIIYNAIRFT